MTIQELTDAGMILIEPGSRLTLANAQELLRAVQALPRGAAPVIVVNMEHVGVVDSAGIGSMVKAQKHVQAVGGALCLAGLRPEIHRMFQMMNLHRVFEMFENVELARKQFSTRRV